MPLVPIPWQPHLFLTERTLGYLQRASQLRGSNIFLVGNDAAWRPYAVQEAYYENYLHHGGPVASDPDVGQRSHMRGAAFDARDTDAKTQKACRDAGLIRDGIESWHWNDPSWASMPIIKTRIVVSGGAAIPITPTIELPNKEEDDDMLNVIMCTQLNAPEYQMIALYGAGYWKEIAPLERGAYFDPWRGVEARRIKGSPLSTDANVNRAERDKYVPITQVDLAEWRVHRDVYHQKI